MSKPHRTLFDFFAFLQNHKTLSSFPFYHLTIDFGNGIMMKLVCQWHTIIISGNKSIWDTGRQTRVSTSWLCPPIFRASYFPIYFHRLTPISQEYSIILEKFSKISIIFIKHESAIKHVFFKSR